jgi:hypothetical protein
MRETIRRWLGYKGDFPFVVSKKETILTYPYMYTILGAGA